MRLPIDGERFLLFGPPKGGKSTMAASFPLPAIINLDGASNERGPYRTAKRRGLVITCTDLDEVNAALDDFKGRQGQWHTLVLDLVDYINVMIDERICVRAKTDTVADIEYGGGWDRQFRHFIRIMEKFWSVAESNPNLKASVLLAHCDSGAKQKMLLREKLAKYITGMVQHIGYVWKQKRVGGTEYMVDFSGDEAREAGSRNSVLQAAKEVKSSYTSIVEVFDPGKSEYERAVKWLTKKGVDIGKFEQWIKGHYGVDGYIAIYHMIKEVSKDPEFLEEAIRQCY